jgi:hypothetical protein
MGSDFEEQKYRLLTFIDMIRREQTSAFEKVRSSICLRRSRARNEKYLYGFFACTCKLHVVKYTANYCMTHRLLHA